MRSPKWLLLQMLQTRITYSKKRVKTFFFLLYYHAKMVSKVSKCSPNVAKIVVHRERKIS